MVRHCRIGAELSFRNSRDNLTANIVQQLSGLLISIVVPMFMGIKEYAQVTVVSVLLGFMPLADLGMSIIYTRKLPALYASEDLNQIRVWNSTIFRFRLYGSLIFGGVVSAYYFQRYPYSLNAVMLFAFLGASVVFSFVTANAIVQSDFRYIRNISMVQSLGRLTILPGVWVAGVKGWFLGQLFSMVVTFFSHRLRAVLHEALTDHKRMDLSLIKENLVQGVIFSLVTTLWLQLLSSGRMYAAFIYPDAVVVQYGLVGAIYQIVVSMSIAVFVPQTIKIYRLLAQDQALAIDYAFKLVVYSAPVFILFGLGLTYIAPIAVEILFPKYNVDRGLYAPFMLSLFNCGVMVTQGSLLIGMGRAKTYLSLIALAAITYFGFINCFRSDTHYHAAAVAQLLTLSTYSVAIVLMVYFISRKKMVNKALIWFACIPSLAGPMLYYFLFR